MSALENPAHVLITGASSGLGAALARAYAAPGRTLSLGGRDADRLEAVAAACRALGATCLTRTADVLDAYAMADWVRAADAERPLALVIANAGISGGVHKHDDPRQAKDADILATNVGGVVNTVEPALALMQERKAVQVAIMSSLASFRGFADAPAYCASKAAVRIYGEGLRRAYRDTSLSISVICPGFVRSPMTDANNFYMPMLMDTDRAARRIVHGLARDRARIAFPWPLYLGVRILAFF